MQSSFSVAHRGIPGWLQTCTSALVLPHLIGSSIDLSAFTGASTPVLFQAGVAAFGVPAAAVVTLALAALAAGTRTLRRRRIVGILRAS